MTGVLGVPVPTALTELILIVYVLPGYSPLSVTRVNAVLVDFSDESYDRSVT